MTLPYDYTRCVGTDKPECRDCRRREPGREMWQAVMTIPPETENGKCPMKIGSEKEGE